MKRITTLIATLAAVFISSGTTEAQNVRAIESRILSMEARIAELESKLAAAQGNQVVAPPQTPEVPTQEVIPQNESYVIRDGDSVGGIARKFSIPRQALLEANNMAEGQPIYIGETLVIPTAPKHEEPVSAAGGQVHIVQAGDTLTGISRKYGTSIGAIKQQNGLKSDIIGTGQKLTIPGSGIADAAPIQTPGQGVQNAVANGGQFQYDNPLLKSDETYGYYAVQKGDNLYALARDFFTTMKELQRLNGLGNSTVIHPGKEMIVPTSKYNDYHNNVVQN